MTFDQLLYDLEGTKPEEKNPVSPVDQAPIDNPFSAVGGQMEAEGFSTPSEGVTKETPVRSKGVIDAEARMFAGTLDMFTCRICSAISGREAGEYKMSSSEKDDFSTITAEYMEATGFRVNAHLQFWIALASMSGVRLYQSLMDRKAEQAEAARLAAAKAARVAAEKKAEQIEAALMSQKTTAQASSYPENTQGRSIDLDEVNYISSIPANKVKSRAKFNVNSEGFYTHTAEGVYVKGGTEERPSAAMLAMIRKMQSQNQKWGAINKACRTYLNGDQ